MDPDATGDTPSNKDKIQAKELDFENESHDKEKSNRQADIDRQIQLAMHIREEEEQLQRIKKALREELVEQDKQKERLRNERLEIERATQASIKDEEEKLRKIKQENLAEKKEKRDQLEQDAKEMAQKAAKLSRQCQKEIDLQTAKQLEENARAVKLGKDEVKQSQIAEMDRLMEVINQKSGNVKSTPMIKVPQPCPCCSAEKHQATVRDCTNTAREKQNKMQGKAGKHHALCMCETSDEETTNGKKWESENGLSNKEKVSGAHRCDPSPIKGQESITSLVTPSESEASLSEPPPPSDPRDDPEDPEWPGFSEKPKKYHFSGTVQDGNKGYFVGWYID